MKKFSYQLCKDGFFAFFDRCCSILKDNRGEGTVSDLLPFKVAEVLIGGTTYLVSSFFKPDAKGNVVDKVRRLIERETEKAAKE